MEPAPAWNAPPVPYEQRLARLYSRLAELYAGHPQHSIRPEAVLRIVGRFSVADVNRRADDRTCKVNARCTLLADATLVMLLEAFTPADVDELLDTARGLLDVRFTHPVRSIREACIEALRHDAETNRLFPQGAICPVDPGVTRP